MYIKRQLSEAITASLSKKMVFIGGPRQVGKTTLSLSYLDPPSIKNPQYLNWDNSVDRSKILLEQIPMSGPVTVLDEIHKYKFWRRLIKGLYDKHREDQKFIVTGSARLDHFRKGGDSLLGRYRYFRLHPISLFEFNQKPTNEDLALLMKFSGFPESLSSQNESEHRIWQKERTQRVIKEDLRDLENVKDISILLLLAEILPQKVGGLLSLNSLSNDLQVSQPSVARWVELFNLLYYSFTIQPFGAPKIKAIKKTSKLYLYDWTLVPEDGGRFENLVASHLLKYCHYIEDTQGHTMELRYLRDTEGREIDFVILKDKCPEFAVECKAGEKSLSKHIPYFKERTKIKSFYQVHLKTKDYGSPPHGHVMPFTTFCRDVLKV